MNTFKKVALCSIGALTILGSAQSQTKTQAKKTKLGETIFGEVTSTKTTISVLTLVTAATSSMGFGISSFCKHVLEVENTKKVNATLFLGAMTLNSALALFLASKEYFAKRPSL